MRDIGIVLRARKYIDSPYVFEFWVTIMLKKGPMRMFSSLRKRINVLKEPK